MKHEDNKIVCRFCKQLITSSYTTYTLEDGEDYIMCDHCDTYFKQLMDREEEA